LQFGLWGERPNKKEKSSPKKDTTKLKG